MKQQSEKRPIIITIFCIMGFLAVPFIIAGFLIPSGRNFLIQQYGFSFILIANLLSILSLAGLIGYWKMRKWGVYIYTAAIIINYIYGFIIGISTNSLSFIVPFMIICAGFANLKKMT